MCVYTGCAPSLLKNWHQHQKVNCWLGNGLASYPLSEAAAVQLAPYRTNTCKTCCSFSPGRLSLLGPYCELQSRDHEPFPQQHAARGQLAPVITTQLQDPLPCLSVRLVLTRVLHATSVPFGTSPSMCSGSHLPAGCFSQPNQTRCRQSTPSSPADSLQHLLLTPSVPWGKAGQYWEGSFLQDTLQSASPMHTWVHMHMSNVKRDAFYPHKMGPCGASPIRKQHQVGPATLSQHQVCPAILS